jgi:hypothetical protein
MVKTKSCFTPISFKAPYHFLIYTLSFSVSRTLASLFQDILVVLGNIYYLRPFFFFFSVTQIGNEIRSLYTYILVVIRAYNGTARDRSSFRSRKVPLNIGTWSFDTRNYRPWGLKVGCWGQAFVTFRFLSRQVSLYVYLINTTDRHIQSSGGVQKGGTNEQQWPWVRSGNEPREGFDAKTDRLNDRHQTHSKNCGPGYRIGLATR